MTFFIQDAETATSAIDAATSTLIAASSGDFLSAAANALMTVAFVTKVIFQA